MSFQSFFKKGATAAFAAASILGAGLSASAQDSTVIAPNSRQMNVAERNNVYCAGYVQTAPVNTSNKIIGATEEQEQFLYTENNDVWINAGANKGVKVGDLYSVIRPRGEVDTKWTKKDDLGFYVQELGVVEVVNVKAEVSVARVRTSCGGMLLGDLIQPFQVRSAPVYVQAPVLNRYADPSGKSVGRLFMARDNQELLGREQIVYVDLGAEDNVRIGDRLTVFRPLGKGHLFISDEDESIDARISDYGSSEYKGGAFSNQAPRKSGERARGKVVTTEKAKDDRPSGLRKVVGELVVLNVKERTATAVVVRTAQEIHTGDWVEIQ